MFDPFSSKVNIYICLVILLATSCSIFPRAVELCAIYDESFNGFPS